VSYYVEEINENDQKEPASHTSTAFFNTNEVAAESQNHTFGPNPPIPSFSYNHGAALHGEVDEDDGMVTIGCDSNANHFTSTEACERACGEYRQQKVCHLGHDSGSCTTLPSSAASLIMKWYYDPRLAKCHTFMYSGCAGNGNRFSSKSECEDLCRREAADVTNQGDNPCELGRDSGPCFDQLTQWYFDATTHECRKFTYGGCRGNANRFNSKDLCQKQCQPMPFHKLEQQKCLHKKFVL
uniref:BPTI/Kunitz inhibitor domain-containing protein n=1 Tax=Ditylenchus dipsaci TaxID=166011 RepID=A0A915EAP4_9BILA